MPIGSSRDGHFEDDFAEHTRDFLSQQDNFEQGKEMLRQKYLDKTLEPTGGPFNDQPTHQGKSWKQYMEKNITDANDLGGIVDTPLAPEEAQFNDPVNSQDPRRQGVRRDVSIIRHGATDLNKEGSPDAGTSQDRVRGWKDVPLNDLGRAEAEKVAGKMGNNKPDVLISSDLKRAHETAQIVSGKSGIPLVEVNPGLRPWNVGRFAGQPSEEAVPKLVDYAENKPNEKVPGGESFNEFQHRFATTLNDLLGRYEGHLGLVTHLRNERWMAAWAAKGYPNSGDVDAKALGHNEGEPPGSVTKFKVPHNQ